MYQVFDHLDSSYCTDIIILHCKKFLVLKDLNDKIYTYIYIWIYIPMIWHETNLRSRHFGHNVVFYFLKRIMSYSSWHFFITFPRNKDIDIIYPVILSFSNYFLYSFSIIFYFVLHYLMNLFTPEWNRNGYVFLIMDLPRYDKLFVIKIKWNEHWERNYVNKIWHANDEDVFLRMTLT